MDNLELRGRIAIAETERDTAIRERDEARAALAVSRMTVDDLTGHCERQGARISKIDRELAAHVRFVRDVWEVVEAVNKPSVEGVQDVLHPFVLEHGIECDACEGTGEVSYSEPIHCGGPTNAYYERESVDECGHCRGGRVPR